MLNNNKRIAIYTRKSKYTEKGDSIGNQIELCINYLKLKFGTDIANKIVIFKDEGFTGANTNRPEFQKMMKELKTGNYCMLVVYRLDRISRNVLDFCELKDNLNNWNVNFISITENFDTTTPMGNAMLMISSVFAQLERDTIAERIKDNLQELAKTGRWLGGNTPLGYTSKKYETISINGKKRSLYQLKKDDNIETVKLIYTKFLELKGISKLETYLIKNNIRTRKGIYFSRFALTDILKNLVYCKADKDIKKFIESFNNNIYNNGLKFDGTHGLISYNKKIQGKTKDGKRKNIRKNIDEWIIAIGKHEGIISGKNWIKVFCLLNKNKYNKRKTYGRTKNESLLSGIIKCEHCGNFMRPKMRESFHKSGKKNFVYMCKLKEKSKKELCNCKNINGIETDLIIQNTIKKLKTSNTEIKKALIEIIKNNDTNIKKNPLDLEKEITISEIDKTNSKITGLIDKLAFANDEVAIILNEEILNLNKKKQNLTKKLIEIQKEISKKENTINIYKFTNNLLKTYEQNWDILELETKRELIKLLTTNITSDGTKIIINFKKDSNNINDSPFNIEHNRPSSKSCRSNP